MFLSLDLKTVAIMLVIFSMMFSLLVAFAKANPQRVSGAGYWAMSGLLVSIGVIVRIVSINDRSDMALVWMLSNTFIVLGLSFNYLGVQRFNDDRPCFWLPIAVLVGLVSLEVIGGLLGLHPLFLVWLGPLLFAALDGAVGYKLLSMRQRGSYWHYFNGVIFMLIALVVLLKLGVKSIELSHESFHTSASQYTFDKLDLFWAFIGLSLKQIVTLVGFSQMMHSKRLQALHDQAMFDHLTGAHNRRGLVLTADALSANCIRAGFDLSMILLDLDHFKRINDTYGHDVGDKVIKAFADTVQIEIRAGDLFGRYGGEEFCLLLPNTTEFDAMSLANRIRESFASLEMPLAGKAEKFSVSAGVSCSAQVGYDFKGLLAAADSALYAAKHQGRNRVVTHTSVSRHVA